MHVRPDGSHPFSSPSSDSTQSAASLSSLLGDLRQLSRELEIPAVSFFGELGGGHRFIVPAVTARHLGSRAFLEHHGVRLAYVAGAMANAIASVELVIACARAGVMAEFGAAGLDIAAVSRSIDEILREVGERAWAINLIHSPQEPELERALVDLFIERKVPCVAASAFMDLSDEIVRYRYAAAEIRGDKIVGLRRVIAKVSRVEVAKKWLAAPAPKLLARLVSRGDLTAEQAEIATRIGVCDDLTIEADSGGHTDNRPALAQFPAMLALREQIAREFTPAAAVRLGLGGGIATPDAVCAAFAMGAAYVVTGSINQSCVEAGTSELVKDMLCKAEQADVAMAPAGDMFEMGVKVQVLKRGTMFAMRAQRLYDLYRSSDGLHALSHADTNWLETQIFRESLSEAWVKTRSYWMGRAPELVAQFEADPRRKMAMLFRSYLGQSSRWAIDGQQSRQADFQVWCGAAMGAFNEWVRGSAWQSWRNRSVVDVAQALLNGAALLTRAHILRVQGLDLPAGKLDLNPLDLLNLSESTRDK